MRVRCHGWKVFARFTAEGRAGALEPALPHRQHLWQQLEQVKNKRLAGQRGCEASDDALAVVGMADRSRQGIGRVLAVEYCLGQ